MYNELNKSVNKIRLTEEAKKRIINNCNSKSETKKCQTIRLVKIVPLVAVLTICIISIGVTIANQERGFLDVKRGTAVVGTVYEESTQMVEIDAEVMDNLLVSAEFVDYTKPPYIYLDVIDISSYKIVDSSGKVVNEGYAKSISEFENGKVTFEIPINDIISGEYRVVINEFMGSKKADQPLPIRGTWECSFAK